MRIKIAVILIILIAMLIACAIKAARSEKSIGRSVSILLCSIIPPVFGNFLIMITTNQLVAYTGYYFFFLGMDLVLYSIFCFIIEYCHIKNYATFSKRTILILFGLDYIQYIFNIFFHQAFDTEPIDVEGTIYIQMVPYLGQIFHRILDYGLLAIILLILVYKTVKSPRIFSW